jgi:hypothetical protein
MTKQNGPRYSDSKDFNEIHDKIVTFLLERGEAIVLDAIEYFGVDVPVVDINCKIEVERSLNEFNIPDLTLTGWVLFDGAHYKENYKFLFEIKGHIRSFGETMRQLMSYKSSFDTTNYSFSGIFLCTPDTRFNKYFLDQGFPNYWSERWDSIIFPEKKKVEDFA